MGMEGRRTLFPYRPCRWRSVPCIRTSIKEPASLESSSHPLHPQQTPPHLDLRAFARSVIPLSTHTSLAHVAHNPLPSAAGPQANVAPLSRHRTPRPVSTSRTACSLACPSRTPWPWRLTFYVQCRILPAVPRYSTSPSRLRPAKSTAPPSPHTCHRPAPHRATNIPRRPIRSRCSHPESAAGVRI